MTKRKLTAEDIFSIELVGDNVRHPSKPKAAVVVQRLLEKENTYQSHIWMVSTVDGSKTLFTNGAKSETAPLWSPDGQWLAFLSNRSGDNMQLYVMPESGGEAIQVTDAKEGVQSFQWTADGTRIVFQTKVVPGEADSHPDANQSGAQGGAKDSPREQFTKDVLHIERSFYRLDGVGFFGDKRVHLFMVDVTRLVHGSYQPVTETKNLKELFSSVQLTDGQFDIDSFDISPSGTEMVVATNVMEDAERTFKQCLYLLDLPKDASAAKTALATDLRCLTPNFHTAGKPKFSADGKWIGFKGEDHQFGPNTQTGLYLYQMKTGEVRWLTQQTDELFENRSMADTRTGTSDALQWSADGRALYTLVSRRGTTQLASVSIENGEVTYLTEGNHCVLSYSFATDDSELVLTVGTATDPANVYLTQVGDSVKAAAKSGVHALRKLTDWNEAFLQTVQVSSPERFEFESDGLTLDGWVMFPAQPAPQTGYPTVLEVHGGPAMMYSESFFFEFQLLTAEGFAVVYTNPRGSVGYGQEFCSCIEMDWGNLDFKDIQTFMDVVIERYPVDATRLGIAGGSYGGFMSAWAIGHTKRFKAAVVMRAVINWYSMMASDIGYASPAEEFGGLAPWEDIERYMRISPITYVNNVETSTLIVHSENDYRCPIDQGEQFYIALKLRGIPVEFLRFPDESHGLSRNGKPWHRVVRLEKIAAFLCRELA